MQNKQGSLKLNTKKQPRVFCASDGFKNYRNSDQPSSKKKEVSIADLDKTEVMCPALLELSKIPDEKIAVKLNPEQAISKINIFANTISTEKTLACSAKKEQNYNTLPRNIKNTKEISLGSAAGKCFFCSKKASYTETISKYLIRSNLSNKNIYNTKIVNDILFNERNHIVSVFKDYLIYDDLREYIKRFYFNYEAKARLPKIFEYYSKYSKVFPNYIIVSEKKYIYRNISRKQRVINEKHEKKTDGNLDEKTLFSPIEHIYSNKSQSEDSKQMTDFLFKSYIKSQDSIINEKPVTANIRDRNLQNLLEKFISKDCKSLIDVNDALKDDDKADKKVIVLHNKADARNSLYSKIKSTARETKNCSQLHISLAGQIKPSLEKPSISPGKRKQAHTPIPSITKNPLNAPKHIKEKFESTNPCTVEKSAKAKSRNIGNHHQSNESPFIKNTKSPVFQNIKIRQATIQEKKNTQNSKHGANSLGNQKNTTPNRNSQILPSEPKRPHIRKFSSVNAEKKPLGKDVNSIPSKNNSLTKPRSRQNPIYYTTAKDRRSLNQKGCNTVAQTPRKCNQNNIFFNNEEEDKHNLPFSTRPTQINAQFKIKHQAFTPLPERPASLIGINERKLIASEAKNQNKEQVFKSSFLNSLIAKQDQPINLGKNKIMRSEQPKILVKN